MSNRVPHQKFILRGYPEGTTKRASLGFSRAIVDKGLDAVGAEYVSASRDAVDTDSNLGRKGIKAEATFTTGNLMGWNGGDMIA
jgi:hypothetical protein